MLKFETRYREPIEINGTVYNVRTIPARDIQPGGFLYNLIHERQESFVKLVSERKGKALAAVGNVITEMKDKGLLDEEGTREDLMRAYMTNALAGNVSVEDQFLDTDVVSAFWKGVCLRYLEHEDKSLVSEDEYLEWPHEYISLITTYIQTGKMDIDEPVTYPQSTSDTAKNVSRVTEEPIQHNAPAARHPNTPDQAMPTSIQDLPNSGEKASKRPKRTSKGNGSTA